jgi:hypothetical protein
MLSVLKQYVEQQGCAVVMFGLAPEAAFTPTLAAPQGGALVATW